MRGFPKFLNSKEDYLYVKASFPDSMWKPEFQKLLDTTHDWFFDHYISDGETIVESENLKVIEPQETDTDQRKAVYVYRINPNCKLLRLGFTIEECENYLK